MKITAVVLNVVSSLSLVLSLCLTNWRKQPNLGGVPPTYLLFFFYYRIRISTKVTQQKPTRCSLLIFQNLNDCNDTDQERFSVVRLAGYRTLWESLTRLPLIDTSDKSYPKQLTVLAVQARYPKRLLQYFFNLAALGLLMQLEIRRRSVAARLRTSWGTCLTKS